MYSENDREQQPDSLPAMSMEVSRERVESLWRQAMAQKSSARSDLSAARANRSKAEMERQKTSNQALEATRTACRELIQEAEHQLARAKQAESQAKQTLADAEQESKRVQGLREGAEEYRERIIKVAQEEALRVREEGRDAALQESAEIKRHVTYEVQCILSEIDAVRAAAQEELETQRIYTDAASIRATSHDVRTQVLAKLDGPSKEDLPTNGSALPPADPKPAEPEADINGVDPARSEEMELVTANGHMDEEAPSSPAQHKRNQKGSGPKDSA